MALAAIGFKTALLFTFDHAINNLNGNGQGHRCLCHTKGLCILWPGHSHI